MALVSAFTPVLAKHSKSFSLIDCIAVGVDRMQRNFEPMRKQVESWQRFELTDVTAKVVIYEAFVEGKLEAPRHLARTLHDLYFEPKYEEFRSRTMWSLSNAFTSAFKELDPMNSGRRQSWAISWSLAFPSRSSRRRYRPGRRLIGREEDAWQSQQQQPKQEIGEQHKGSGGCCALPEQAYARCQRDESAEIVQCGRTPRYRRPYCGVIPLDQAEDSEDDHGHRKDRMTHSCDAHRPILRWCSGIMGYRH